MARLLVGRVRPVPGVRAAVYRRGTGARHQVGASTGAPVASRAGAATAKKFYWMEAITGTTRMTAMAGGDRAEPPQLAGTPQTLFEFQTVLTRPELQPVLLRAVC